MSWGSGGPGIRARALRPAWVPSPSAVGAGTSSGLRGPLLPGTHPPAARPQAGGPGGGACGVSGGSQVAFLVLSPKSQL